MDVTMIKPTLKAAIVRYLHETLGLDIKFRERPGSKAFPHILQDAYDFYEVKILDQWFLFFTPIANEPVSPATLAKQFTWLTGETGNRGIFGASTLAAYTRRRLMGYKIPFIVPGNQLYLPDLGIDLREYFKKQQKPDKMLTPQAQFVLLAYLLRRPAIDKWTASSLAAIFQTTRMTTGRAIDNLAGHELIEIIPKGREREIQFIDTGKGLWEKALPALSSPVNKRRCFETFPLSGILLSGLSALSAQTMLAEPKRKVLAISHTDWNRKYRSIAGGTVPAEDAPIEVELWRYDPKPLSVNNIVDPLSLYLSLKDEPDERIEQAREQLLKELAW
jgi:DNA-binding MarR family transcriptional regulator